MKEKLDADILKHSKGAWYSIPGEAINKLTISAEENELFEDERVFGKIISQIQDQSQRGEPCLIAFDGFLGTKLREIVSRVDEELKNRGIETHLLDFSEYFRGSNEIKNELEPYLNVDPEWGRVYRGRPKDFLDLRRVEELRRYCQRMKRNKRLGLITIVYGTFSAVPPLRKLYDIIYFIDITIERLFRRLRETGEAYALGSRLNSPVPLDPKRFFYADYVLLRKHKKYLLNYIDWYILDEYPNYKMISASLLNRICSDLAEGPIRPKPFYIPGVWGGEWIKSLKPKLREVLLSPDVPLSWEIDLVDILQSVRVSVDGTILEIPLLIVLWKEGKRILGKYVYKKYRGRLPLTMSYDDTYNSGSLAKGEGLAIQVHPGRSYLKRRFNENFGHHESYYILDVGPGAKTYQGLKEDADVTEFYEDVIKAKEHGVPFDHNKYVDSFPSRRGDLFLNPAGTIHASGRNQVVLEPDLIPLEFPGYVFHFYDYLRIDLDGKPRGIHPEHAFQALKNRRTRWVVEHLQLKPKLLRAGDDWREYLIGECREAEYMMCRLEFLTEIGDNTHGTVQLLTLVDGKTVVIKSKDGKKEFKLNFGETVIIPASYGEYTIECLDHGDGWRTPAGTPVGPTCKILKFFIKHHE